MSVVFNPAIHCGSASKRCRTDPTTCAHTDGDHRCRLSKGAGTEHLGVGACRYHGGSTPNGEKHASTEKAERAIARLGLPRGNGDPFALLASAVQHAHGHLEATSAVVQEAVTAVEKTEAGDATKPALMVEAAVELYEAAIRNASRVGKQAVDADVADRLAALDERASGLVMRFVTELLERVVPKIRRPEIEAWASARLGELAAEYDRPGTVH